VTAGSDIGGGGWAEEESSAGSRGAKSGSRAAMTPGPTVRELESEGSAQSDGVSYWRTIERAAPKKRVTHELRLQDGVASTTAALPKPRCVPALRDGRHRT
jgi:hypothetical protein